MFTSIDKALVALIMAVVFLIAKYWPPIATIVNEDVVNALVPLIIPLVWATPNKTKT